MYEIKKSFFEMDYHALADWFDDHSKTAIVWTVRGIDLRASGFVPLFRPGATPWSVAYRGDRVNLPNWSDTLTPEPGWVERLIDERVVVNWSGYKNRTDVGTRVSYPELENRYWFYSSYSGIVRTPPITPMNPGLFEGLRLEDDETIDMYTGTFGASYSTAQSWMWPFLLHWQSEQEGIVGYYDNIADVLMGRKSNIKLGRFFAKLGLDSVRCEWMVDRIRGMSRKMGGEVKFAVTADEIAKVYQSGPNSCMSWDKIRSVAQKYAGKKDDYRNYNPVRAYVYPLGRTELVPDSGNSLGFAYLGDLDNGITARCIVDLANKTFGRIYGSPSIEGKLKMLGYRGREYFSMENQILSLIEKDGVAFFPYIDDSYCNGLVMSDGRIKLVTDTEIGSEFDRQSCATLAERGIVGKVVRASSGYQAIESKYACAHCGRSHTNRRGLATVRYPDNAKICDNCATSHYILAVLSIPTDGPVQQVFAQAQDVTRIDGVVVITSALSEVTSSCADCGTTALRYLMHTAFDRPLCRACARAEDLRRNYMVMYYYDFETGGLGQSTFRATDGVTVIGYDRPVHIVSIGRLANRCPDCRVIYRTGTEHHCDNE